MTEFLLYKSIFMFYDTCIHIYAQKSMQETVTNDHPVILTTEIRFKLYSLGLVKLRNDEVTPRCELYRQYFRTSIKDNQKII